MRRRLYPETAQALAFYWLKTVYAAGYQREEWLALDGLLQQSVTDDAVVYLQGRIRGLLNGGSAASSHAGTADSRGTPGPDILVPYVVRLLNEWLPLEVARLLVPEPEEENRQEAGIPSIAIGRAIERLLLRERLSPATLEAILHLGLFTPQFVYPADLEILRDVILFLLGRTEASTAPVLPAMLLSVAPGAPLAFNYGDAVQHAFLADGAEGEELRVPITSDQAMHILTGDHVRITSVVVTMDGRWWQAGKLGSGEDNTVSYRPMGRLGIDYSADHARLRVPWPEERQSWPGLVSLGAPLDIFGRRWRVAQWEQDAEHAWLNLVFADALPATAIAPDAEPHLRRSKPASVDMAWTSLEDALAAAVAQNHRDPIEQLRRGELVPLGRALFALTESLMNRRSQKPEAIEARLRAVTYHSAELEESYGHIPWRVLPQAARKALLQRRLYVPLEGQIHGVFEGLPLSTSHPSSPSQAA